MGEQECAEEINNADVVIDYSGMGNDQVEPSASSNDFTSPLLQNRDLRQRRSSDIESGFSRISQRILDRNAGFRQSRGRWSVHRISRSTSHANNVLARWCCQRKLWDEWNLGGWFHRLAYQRTGVLMLILFVVYASIVALFACIYLAMSIFGQRIETNPDGSEKLVSFCHMEINNRMEALYMSLSTMAAVGYGVSNYYFSECWTPLILVLAQVCSAILFDAVAVGLLFHRISRGRKRGRTIAFSDKAVIQRVNGVSYLMFRIGELRKYHLIGATVRCHCVRHERMRKEDSSLEDNEGPNSIETTFFVSRQVNLLHPDQTYNSDVWMGLPQVLVHRMVDGESPLVPPAEWYDASGALHKRVNTEATPTFEGTQAFLLDREVEIIVLIEGTDEGTGSQTQARHSYKVSDLAWNHKFEPCIFPYGQNREHSGTAPPMRRPGQPVCSVDFSKFHEIRSCSEDCRGSPYVPP